MSEHPGRLFKSLHKGTGNSRVHVRLPLRELEWSNFLQQETQCRPLQEEEPHYPVQLVSSDPFYRRSVSIIGELISLSIELKRFINPCLYIYKQSVIEENKWDMRKQTTQKFPLCNLMCPRQRTADEVSKQTQVQSQHVTVISLASLHEVWPSELWIGLDFVKEGQIQCCSSTTHSKPLVTEE